ncbi:hypothetical protein H2248_007090 [Termitomyces sp. 'cryptogamus']|nr:hypothetical protein H2248_007090 [Termitomyces sp. 'cryptogamus']
MAKNKTDIFSRKRVKVSSTAITTHVFRPELNGSDLLRPDGALPWSIPLALSQSPLRELAIQDGLIDAEAAVYKLRDKVVFLAFLEQPFVLNLERHIRMAVLTPRKIEKLPQLRVLFPNLLNRNLSLFKGKLLVSFEQAPLEPSVNGTSIVMRVLKILEPIKPLVEDATIHQLIPVPGALLKCVSRGRIQIREFESPYLKLLPSVEFPALSLSDGLQHDLPKLRKKTLFADLARTISTLVPCRLQPSDFVVLSGRKGICITGRHVQSQKRTRIPYFCKRTPFPANTHGFFYMHINPRLPLVSGQIRFRITPSNDPAQFENGVDLFSRGEPWNIDIVQIAHSAPLKEQLHCDGYAKYVQALSSLSLSKCQTRRLLCYLEQPFIADLSHPNQAIGIILRDKIAPVLSFPIMVDRRNYKYVYPYTGRIVVRFERSTLQQHAGGNFLVLRVLKILDPITPADPDYDMYLPMPRVGSLVVVANNRVRSFDLDEGNSRLGNLKYLPSLPDVEPDLEAFR